MEDTDKTFDKNNPPNTVPQGETGARQDKLPAHVMNRRFFNLVTGGDMSKWCSECGGICSNSNHRPERRL